jgi:hypothetical protein
MARDTLDTLLRLRRLEVRQQMRALAAAIQAEEQAHRTRDVCASTIVREAAEAQTLAQRDAALAGFEPWRAHARRALRDAEIRMAAAAEATQAAREVLGQARGAMRAVELAIERRQVEAELVAQRSTQHALDDAARRPDVADW